MADEETTAIDLSDGLEISQSDVAEDKAAERVISSKRVKAEPEGEAKFDLGEFELKEGAEAPAEDRDERIKTIKKDFPTLFTKYPSVRSAIFQARALKAIFGSVENAQYAAERVGVLENIEADLFERHTARDLLRRLYKADQNDFARVIQSILPEIRAISEEAYLAMILPVLDELIVSLDNAGTANGDDNVKNAALLLNMYIHRTKILPGRTAVAPTPAEEEVSEQDKANWEAQQWMEQQTRLAQGRVMAKVHNVLSTNLEKMIDNPELTPYIREKLIGDIIRQTVMNLNDDDTHVGNINQLWRRAARMGYDGDSLNSIIRVVLQKITKILPRIKADLETQALGNEPEKNEQGSKGDTEETPAPKRHAREIDWRETSDMDFLSGKVKFREK